MAEIGITQFADSDFVPGKTFHGIRTASCDSKSRNSAMAAVVAQFVNTAEERADGGAGGFSSY